MVNRDETISVSLTEKNFVSIDVFEYENISVKMEEIENIKTILYTPTIRVELNGNQN